MVGEVMGRLTPGVGAPMGPMGTALSTEPIAFDNVRHGANYGLSLPRIPTTLKASTGCFLCDSKVRS